MEGEELLAGEIFIAFRTHQRLYFLFLILGIQIAHRVSFRSNGVLHVSGRLPVGNFVLHSWMRPNRDFYGFIFLGLYRTPAIRGCSISL